MMPLISLIVGFALLVAGRKIFWLAVAAIGFTAGMKLTPIFVEAQSPSTLILIALGIGLISALVAIVLQKVAVGLSGFISGAYGAFVGMHRVGLDFGNLNWVPMLLLGLVGLSIA